MRRDDVMPDQHRAELIRRLPHGRTNRVVEPPGQICLHRKALRIDESAGERVRPQAGELVEHLAFRRAVHGPSSAPAVLIVPDRQHAAPETIRALEDRTFPSLAFEVVTR